MSAGTYLDPTYDVIKLTVMGDGRQRKKKSVIWLIYQVSKVVWNIFMNVFLLN